eukprot:SAG31_NODE_1655_length_7621_cov_3.211912_3_plen_68_part_00
MAVHVVDNRLSVDAMNAMTYRGVRVSRYGRYLVSEINIITTKSVSLPSLAPKAQPSRVDAPLPQVCS